MKNSDENKWAYSKDIPPEVKAEYELMDLREEVEELRKKNRIKNQDIKALLIAFALIMVIIFLTALGVGQ
jgi:hypothetical protein